MLQRAYREGFKPPPKLTLSEWADTRRKLSQEGSAEHGQWITARAEYQRGMMDAVSDPANEVIVAVLASQLGKTDALILNTLGYYIDQEPSPILVVEPRVDDAKSLSKDRVAPMLRDTPVLRGKVAEARSRDSGNTTLLKEFPGGRLTLGGANSPAGLAMRPIRVLLFDEVDRYPRSAGSEGDPVSIATKRTSTFWNRKIVMVSSPTNEGASRISDAYLETDQRRYFVPCPHCGHRQVLRWPQVVWEKTPEGKGRPDTAGYRCEAEDCGTVWNDGERWAAVSAGKWRPTVIGGPARKVGFHLSALASPWKRLEELVAEWLEVQGKPERLQTFMNTVLAECWRVPGEAPEWQRLYDRRERWPTSVVPVEVLFLTAGVDVQKDRLEARVWGWGRHQQSWLIETRIMVGDTSRDVVWAELDRLLHDTWEHSGGALMKLTRLGVDSGYATREVAAWARRNYSDARIMVTKGDNRGSAIVRAPSLDTTSGGKRLKGGVRPWMIPVDTLKATTYGWLRQDAPLDGQAYPAGYVHLSRACTDDEIKQLTAEQRVKVTKKSGFTALEWVLVPGRRNEALDCRVIAHAGAISFGMERFGRKQWDRLASMLAVEPEFVETPVMVVPKAPPPAEAEEGSEDPSPFPTQQQRVVEPTVPRGRSRQRVSSRSPWL